MTDGTNRLNFTASVIFIAFFLIFTPRACAQKQLVLLKKQQVILRLSFGDEIVYKTKGSKNKITSYVNNLFDTAVMAHNTVVPFHQIERLYFKRSGGLLNKIGGGLLVGGILYFAIDQLNEIVVKGDEATLNEKVTTVSVAMVAVGLPMMLIKKKSQRIKHGYRLLTVDRDSHFYRQELEHMSF